MRELARPSIHSFISYDSSSLFLARLLGLASTELRCRGILLRLLGETDGTGTGNGGGAEVRSVSRLGDLAGNGLVCPEAKPSALLPVFENIQANLLSGCLVATEGGLV